MLILLFKLTSYKFEKRNKKKNHTFHSYTKKINQNEIRKRIRNSNNSHHKKDYYTRKNIQNVGLETFQDITIKLHSAIQ